MWSVWLVFYDCSFHSSCPLMNKYKKLPDGRDWLRGKLGLVLMGGAMLSKSLIQFSVDGQGCVPSLLFDLRPNYGGSNKDNGALFKRSHACAAANFSLHNQKPTFKNISHIGKLLNSKLSEQLLYWKQFWKMIVTILALFTCLVSHIHIYNVPIHQLRKLKQHLSETY